mgnify:CR=1 FL=1
MDIFKAILNIHVKDAIKEDLLVIKAGKRHCKAVVNV